jgi:hypothetical protein
MKAEQYLRRKFGEIYIPNTNANAGINIYNVDTNQQHHSWAQSGLRNANLHLADARGHSASDLSDAEAGLKIYLAEHSLDRGG